MNMRQRLISDTKETTSVHMSNSSVIAERAQSFVKTYQMMEDSTLCIEGIYPFKPVDHRSIDGDIFPHNTQQMVPQCDPASHINDYMPYCNVDLGHFPDYLDWDEYGARFRGVLDEVLPRIKPATDILVFLAELKDLKKTALKLKRLMSKENIRHLSKVKVLLKPSKMMDGFSEITLENAFGTGAFVRDVISLVEGVMSWQKRLDELIEGEGVIHKRHGGFRDRKDGVTHTFYDGHCNSPGSCGYTRYWCYLEPVTDVQIKGGLTVMYTYTLPDDAKKLGGKVRAFLQALGLSPGVSTVWDLIPFSFILDWFIPIGDFLDQYDQDVFKVNTLILDLCVSLSYTVGYELRDHGCQTGGPDSSQNRGRIGQTFATYTDKHYQRLVGVENLPSAFKFKLPSGYQLLLGSAIAWVIGRRRS